MKRVLSLLPVVVLLLVAVPSSSAQSGNGYDLSWNVIADGGTTFSLVDSYTLGATLGQSGACSLSGGNYTLSGGFWNSVITNFDIYLPIVLRS